jgi:hypothetical protein
MRGATQRPLGAWTRTWSPTCVNTSEWPIDTSASSQKLECAGKSSKVWSYGERNFEISSRNELNKNDIQLVLEAYMLHTNLAFCHSSGVVDRVGCIVRACVERELWKCPKCHSLQIMISKIQQNGFEKGTIGNVILHPSTGVYFEFSGLSKRQISM